MSNISLHWLSVACQRLAGWWGGAASVLLLLACAFYWVHLLGDHADRPATDVESQTRQRAVRLSAHMTTQVSTLLAGLEYLAKNLAATYEDDPGGAFCWPSARHGKRFPEQHHPGGRGRCFGASDLLQPAHRRPVGVDCRPGYFRVHAQGWQPRLFISQPGHWAGCRGSGSIQFSYPVESDGRFAGVSGAVHVA